MGQKNLSKKQKNQQNSQFKITVLVLGAFGAGKTCLIQRMVSTQAEHNFNEQHISTIGIDFCKGFYLVKEKPTPMYFWQATGGERFMMIAYNIYVPSSDCFIFVYDVCDRNSFQYVKILFKNVLDKKQSFRGKKYGILVGNKSDKGQAENRVVSFEEGQQLGSMIGGFQEVSAKTGENCKNMLDKLLQKLLKQTDPDIIQCHKQFMFKNPNF